jgi:PII-like signaling protein
VDHIKETLMENIENIDDGKLLRVLIGEDDEYDGRPLFEAIVLMLRKEGLAGATVLRGIEGFGASSRIHTAKVLRLSEDMPIVIESVDRADNIERVLPLLDLMITEGMVTVEKVEIRLYRGRPH